VLYEISTGLDRRMFPDLPTQLKEWPDGGAVLELNEVCAQSVRQQCLWPLSDMREDAGGFETLSEGRSIQRRRTREQWLGAFKKAGLALTVPAVVAAAFFFGTRQLAVSRLFRGRSALNEQRGDYIVRERAVNRSRRQL